MVFEPSRANTMLTGTELRNIKPKDKLYKASNRDGLWVAVTAARAISSPYNCSIHGRPDTITFGRYGVGGITLADGRERSSDAKKMIAAGNSPASEKARNKARVKDAETFGARAERWLLGYQMADSIRDMRRSVYERELQPKFGNRKLVEITREDLRALTDALRARCRAGGRRPKLDEQQARDIKVFLGDPGIQVAMRHVVMACLEQPCISTWAPSLQGNEYAACPKNNRMVEVRE